MNKGPGAIPAFLFRPRWLEIALRRGYFRDMDKDAVIDILRRHRPELERRGVRHAALFGSVARGEAGPESDIDIAIDLDVDRHPTVYDYVGMQQYIVGLLDGPVDVVDRAALKAGIRERVAADLIHAF